MSNIYLKVTFEKNWRSQNFDFLGLKNCHQVSFWGAPIHTDIIKFSNFFLQLKNQRSGSKTLCGFSNILILSPCILFNKNINFYKNETESKMGNPTHSFREMNLVLQLIYESQIKSKTVMSWISRKKKEDIFWCYKRSSFCVE